MLVQPSQKAADSLGVGLVSAQGPASAAFLRFLRRCSCCPVVESHWMAILPCCGSSHVPWKGFCQEPAGCVCAHCKHLYGKGGPCAHPRLDSHQPLGSRRCRPCLAMHVHACATKFVGRSLSGGSWREAGTTRPPAVHARTPATATCPPAVCPLQACNCPPKPLTRHSCPQLQWLCCRLSSRAPAGHHTCSLRCCAALVHDAQILCPTTLSFCRRPFSSASACHLSMLKLHPCLLLY
jgi:hypothetical protein